MRKAIKASPKPKKTVSKTTKNSHLLDKEATWDINTVTGQLVSQLLYKSSSLIENREPKHLEEMIELVRVYKRKIKTYRKDDSSML